MNKRMEILINGKPKCKCDEDLMNILLVLLRNDTLFRRRTLSYVLSLEKAIKM